MAQQQLIDEDVADLIDDAWHDRAELSARHKAALALTDTLLGDPGRLDRDSAQSLRAVVREELGVAECAELSLHLAMFLSTSKALIVWGLEPDQMPTTVLPHPGSPAK